MLHLFDAARRVSVPILVVRTADQYLTVETLAKRANKAHALVQWDAANGLLPVATADGVNKPGAETLKRLGIKPEATQGFVEAMIAVQQLPQGAIVFALNAHRQLHSNEPMSTAAAVQAVANLRDQFKRNFRMLVALGPYGFQVPPELDQDVVILTDPLPGPEELGAIITELQKATAANYPKLPAMSAETKEKATEAVSGLSGFAAEQQTSMSFTEQGLDIPALWERKRVTIEQTHGLRVWRGKETFADLVGLASVKAKLRSRLTARTPVGVVVFVDEIDKVLANVEQDTSGVRMDQLRSLLTEMEDNEWRGLVAVGVAGGGKSAIAKAFGNEAGVPTIQLDFGAMEGSLVGESEQKVRHAMAIIKAVGRGNAYFIATSNNASVMRPELQRRFNDGFFFFDVMTSEERAATWAFYMKKYELKKQQMPDDNGWTGAEIRNCCREAWDTRTMLVEAARFIMPMSQSRGDTIDELRRYAHGRFLDASKAGTYQWDPAPLRQQVRAITLPDAVALEAALTVQKES